MKNPENQLNSSTPQDASTHSSNAQPTQSSADKHFKKPHMKLFNCVMKPSLSLTSLPPQSPKEASDETQSVERPYNSLKKKRDVEKELWRRSWESQASISTTTSHTGTSGGKNGNDFWAAYNFIMDTNLIDSCREAASGESNKAGSDVAGEFRAFKTNGDQDHFTTSRSQGSLSTDPRRLRRWLREMEANVSKVPSLKESMKLNTNELKKFSLESADLYREIVAHGRAVAACIRSLEKENSSKVDDQPKSLDSVEHDSLDTIATTTSADSGKRGENVLKALERRYHLLYLRAIEIQCMFESLLERRSNLEAAEDFHPAPVDTSDEEPVAKVAKFSCDSNFTSCKQRDDSKTTINESDADSEGSEGEMECVAVGDCVDGTIVPVKQATPPKTPSPNASFETPKGTVIKRARPKDFSKFHRSNRKSKNCAIFYYKHVDTDTDQFANENGDDMPIVSSEASEEEVWEFSNTSNDVSPLTPDKERTMNDELECFPLEVSPEIDHNSQQQQNGFASNTTKLINTKESLRELVLEAESLVRQKINDRTSKTEYFFNEIIAKSKQQRQKKMMEKNQKDSVKINRVQEWLKRHQESDAAITVQPSPVNDCEASGEYTSGESGNESESSEEITDSIATCLQGVDMQTSTEGLGSGIESVPMNKVTMRAKSSNRRNSDRPWSVSCLSQLTRNSRQSLIDTKMVETTSTTLANFSISESALHNLSPQQYKNTSESDSKNCSRNAQSTVGSVGSKNSLRRRRAKLRKKSYSSIKRSESGSEIPSSDVSRNILRSMTKSESFSMGTSLMEDLSVAISMMTIVKNNQEIPQAQKPESEEDQMMMKPDFKIGSYTNVYANPASNLGSLAALANYNREKNDQDLNETGTENMSSFSEQTWDNYMEKYNSEAYSEDRDIDGARRLLEFGDDYRNFIDSQSDCCSSLSAANIDSLSPPRHRKNFAMGQNQSLSSNDNSMKMMRQRRIQELPEMERRRLSNGEDRKSVFVEMMRQKNLEAESSVRRRSFQSGSRPQSYKSSSSDHSDHDHEMSDKNIMKILAECKTNLERTEALRMANPQLLRTEDYEEIFGTCRKNVDCLEAFLRAGNGDVKTLRELIASWNNLLNWSENAAVARRLQEEIIMQKQLLDSIAVENGDCLDTEEAIREKIQELNNAREHLQKHRSNMLKLNASVHSWLTRQEMQRNEELKAEEESGNERTTQSDLRTFADDELHKHLKDEIVSLYAKWDSVNYRITSRLESLSTSLVCWKQFENGLFEFQENLSKDRGALVGLQGAIEDGTGAEDLVDNVHQVSKLLSEKLENKINQTISTNEDLLLHPEAALQFIATSNGSLSDSGISDGGFSELSERERRLIALKKIAKQLENALSPSSEVLKTITQRMEAAENELKILQNTCRELIVKTSNQLLQQQGIDIPPITNAQSQINVQIPIITIKGKSAKRSLPRRTKRKSPHSITSRIDHQRLQDETNKLHPRSFNDELELNAKSDSELDEADSKETTTWGYLRRIAKLAVPVQLAIVTLFCVACLLEPRCCDTLNNLSMSFTPQLRYVKGPPPT